MKTFNLVAAQGELRFRKVGELADAEKFIRKDMKDLDASGQHFVVGHSETGHHHVMVADRERVEIKRRVDRDVPQGMNILLLIVKDPNGITLEHQREYDTHEPLHFSPGVYEMRSQREYESEARSRAVMD